MNYIDHFAAEISQSGGKTVEWTQLRNVYFREGSTTEAMRSCEAWAKVHGFHVSVDYSEETAGGGGIPRCVTFSPIRL